MPVNPLLPQARQVFTLQVTLGAAKTQVSATSILVNMVVFQNNAAAVMRVGDTNVSTTRGVSLASGGVATSVLTIQSLDNSSIDLSTFYAIGTNTQLLDVLYVV